MTDMVPIFLARTVEGLAAFEDTLLKRDGFFQRQEHFEAKIEAVRLELDRNSRAKTVFANPDAVQLLIASLTAETRNPQAGDPARSCAAEPRNVARVFASGDVVLLGEVLGGLVSSLLTSTWCCCSCPGGLRYGSGLQHGGQRDAASRAAACDAEHEEALRDVTVAEEARKLVLARGLEAREVVQRKRRHASVANFFLKLQ